MSVQGSVGKTGPVGAQCCHQAEATLVWGHLGPTQSCGEGLGCCSRDRARPQTPLSSLGTSAQCSGGRGLSAAPLGDMCSAPAAQWHGPLQRHPQQHHALSLWENHLPPANVAAAALRGEGERLPGAPARGAGWGRSRGLWLVAARFWDAEATFVARPAVLGSCHPARVFLGPRREEEGSSLQEIFLHPRFPVHPPLLLHAGPVVGRPSACGWGAVCVDSEWIPDPRPQRAPGAPSCSGSVGQQLPLLSVVPVSHLSFSPQSGQARTPGPPASKPRRPGHNERNKENVQLNGTALSGGCMPVAPAQRNHSINSVASTYSEFAVIHLF